MAKTRKPAAAGSEKPGSMHGDAMKVQPEHRHLMPAEPFRRRLPGELSEDEPTEVATVARGRTVQAPAKNGKKRVAGQTQDGAIIYAPEMAVFGPGQTVTLPVSEVKRLKELGFLVDPDRSPIPQGMIRSAPGEKQAQVLHPNGRENGTTVTRPGG